MNKKTLGLVIVFASLALLGLMAIQIIWIRNSLEVRQENFRRGVSDAARQVVRHLEQIDALKLLEHGNKAGNGIAPGTAEMDSLRLAFDQYLNEHPDVFEPGTGRKHQHNGNQGGRGPNKRRTEYGPGTNISPKPMGADFPVFGENVPDSLKKAVIKEFVRRKTELMEKALEEMLGGDQPMNSEHRLTQGLVDTLLKAELDARGIYANYVFGIFNPMQNNFTILTDPAKEDEILKSGLIFTLFPSDNFANPDFLMIHFPGQRSYLLTQMWGLLGVSVILLIIIILSFIYSITTVLRQRKFAEMKNDFINNMTHEFKTPISTISLACEALGDADVQKSEQLYVNYISIISDENKRIGIMAEKILQTAVIEKGELRLKKESIDLHSIIEDVIRNIRIQVEIKDGNITTLFHAKNHRLEGDKVHMSNVIYNLLDNANKYTPRKPVISIISEDIPNGIRVSIQDNGIGISKSDQKKVFDKLYRVPMGDVHDFKGFGLGLSYVKAIIEQHGGRVGVESESGKGSSFWFTLPA